MWRAIIIACIVLVAAVLVGVVIVTIFIFSPYGTAIHMRNVTQQLAEWQKRYDGRELKDDGEAKFMIEMLEYVQWYYVPSDGYRGDAATEAALQAQRSATIEAIITALRQYSREDYGADADQWHKWLDRRRGTKGQSPEEEKEEGKVSGYSFPPKEYENH